MQFLQLIDYLKLIIHAENIAQQLIQQEHDIKIIQNRVQKLEQQIPSVEQQSNKLPKSRRLANDIDRNFQCPYTDCRKSYGSEISMNLHIRIKHNGGSKIDRELVAKEIIQAKLQGREPPKSNLQLPPRFLDEFCDTYQEFLKSEIKKAQESEIISKACDQKDMIRSLTENFHLKK